MDCSPLIRVREGDFNTDGASTAEMDTLENFDDSKQTSKGKPPRHLSAITSATSRLQVAVNMVSFFILRILFCVCLWDPNDDVMIGFCLCVQDLDVCNLVIKSPGEKPEFSPVYRSGSCAEQGAKQFMEDEHICIDDLVEHLGPALEFSSLGAFYGVSVPSDLYSKKHI